MDMEFKLIFKIIKYGKANLRREKKQESSTSNLS
jgi:hypothetical protein